MIIKIMLNRSFSITVSVVICIGFSVVVDGDACAGCAINSEAEFNISLLVLFVIFGILGTNLYNDQGRS